MIKESERVRVTVYVSRALRKRIRRHVANSDDGLRVSHVIERLLEREFNSPRQKA